jgi:acyl-CoA thioesterase-1
MNPALWSSPHVSAEPLFFMRSEGRLHATARLLLTPQTAPALTKATGETAYELGRDFTWTPGTREIELTPSSHIPFRNAEELLPPPGASDSIDGNCDSTRHLLYGEGHFFHDQQVLAGYVPAEPWSGPRPAADPTGLARTLARLRTRQPLKIVLLGDSISTGANASGPMGAPPHQPAYQDLVVSGLRARFDAPVSLTNLAVGGMSAPWGVEQMPAAIAAAPDLFILAFGMNDASGRRPPAEFRELTRQMAVAMQAAHPACEVIAVATMTANPAWKYAAPDLYPAYLAALNTLRAPGFAVADVTTLWSWTVSRKSYHDLTGNGVNHPNDFGHRLYAEVILALFG